MTLLAGTEATHVRPSSQVGASTIPGVFFEQARRLGDRPYLHFFRDGGWHTLTWRETAEGATRSRPTARPRP
jgi:hypothetical protein